MSVKFTADITYVLSDSSRLSGGSRIIKVPNNINSSADLSYYNFEDISLCCVGWFTTVPISGNKPDPLSVAGYDVNQLWDLYSLYHDLGVRYIELNVRSNDDHERIIRLNLDEHETSDPDLQRDIFTSYSYIKDGVTLINETAGTAGGFDAGYETSTLYFQASHRGDTIPWLIWDRFRDEINFGKYFISANYRANYDGGYPYDVNYVVSSIPFPSQNDKFQQWLGDWQPEDSDDEDPYPDPDDPEDDSDDPQPDPLPGISVVGSGFATIFTPDISQLRNLSGLFWNETVFDFFQNLVENISDMFLSLAMVPFVVPAGRTVSVTWLGIDTAISLTLAARQFVEFNMGSINLGGDNRIWRSESALDFSPFSQLGIYLPFIGFRDLDIDDCRDKVMNLKYRIDLLSGECVAIISLNDAVYYQFSGNCLTQIPITNEGMQSLVADAVQVGLAVAAVGSAGGGAAAAEGAAAESGAAGAIQEIRTTLQTTPQGRQLASATANAVIGGKPMYGKTGSVSGAGGLLAVRQPYLYLKTPVSAIPTYYRRYCGYPCNKSGKLSSFTGYTVVEDIRLNNLVATSAEVSEIYDLLKGGVII